MTVSSSCQIIRAEMREGKSRRVKPSLEAVGSRAESALRAQTDT